MEDGVGKFALEDGGFHYSTHDGVHACTVSSRGEHREAHLVRLRFLCHLRCCDEYCGGDVMVTLVSEGFTQENFTI